MLCPSWSQASAWAVLLTPVMRKVAGPQASRALLTIRMDGGSVPSRPASPFALS